jgi:ABC-type bacteriocin/lantibiotic exporter with double-glycine peptidase domain
MPDGDLTRVGHAGNMLSGGQRQRVALARAVLSNPRILLLDDSLSAINPSTADLLLQALLVNKPINQTVIMVTNQMAHAKRCNRILAVSHDEICEVPLESAVHLALQSTETTLAPQGLAPAVDVIGVSSFSF